MIDVKESYNIDGIRLSDDNMYIPSDPMYFDEDRKPKWDEYIEYSDAFGFDVRHRFSDGGYIRKEVLPPGKRIIRFGNDIGSFTTDIGTDYSLLSLPYKKESVPYHEYIVEKECEVLCYVDEGIVAPGFGSNGGAIQYRHYLSIYDSLRMGVLKEEFGWLNKKM